MFYEFDEEFEKMILDHIAEQFEQMILAIIENEEY